MARKKRHEEHENHERWLVSYADFITLLFAFFVVMYSVSSINEGKYRVLSSTLTDAFLVEAQSMNPVQVGEQVRTLTPVAGEYASPEQGASDPSLIPDPIPEITKSKTPNIAPDLQSMEAIQEKLTGVLDGFIEQNLVNVTQTDKGIQVEMKSKMLFESGSARLSRDALKVLRGVADVLSSLPNQIHVEGHTDNVPIRTVSFPSNWELSAARAASVVHLFTRMGVDSYRMAAIGYGEHRPIAGNDTEEGRQKNRRVSLIVMTDEHGKEVWDTTPLIRRPER
jgi:chemotaxis protein MotB